MTRPRVVIAEDYVLLQDMICQEVSVDCEVVAMVEDGAAALEAVGSQQPDILLADVGLADAGVGALNAFELTRRVGEQYPDVRVVFLTAHNEPAYVERAFAAGARAYVLKSAIGVELRKAIRVVMEGGSFRSVRLA